MREELSSRPPHEPPGSRTFGARIWRDDLAPDTAQSPAIQIQSNDLKPNDHHLIGRARAGDQDAAAQLYARYARRLTNLVERQCSRLLARCAGVEDLVQSIFGSFFRRVDQGLYDIPDGDELWKLLLVLALNKIRSKATYYRALKRDAVRNVGGAQGESLLQLHACARDVETEHFEMVLNEILDRLPAECRSMAKLRLDGREVGEIAHSTGRSRRSVERILQETRRKLRGLLHEEQ